MTSPEPAEVKGGICVARGFLAAGVRAGIKTSGALDLALLVSEEPASVAGLFTKNLASAAPVRVSKSRVQRARGRGRGVVVNSGCANACTGKQGTMDAEEMADLAAAAAGVDPGEMLVCSTGLIGSRLPMAKVREGVKAAAGGLGRQDEGAAQAIMTTDTRPKRTAVRHPDGWSVGGMAKGAGMIAPDMATMLAFVTSDAEVEAAALHHALEEVADATFNAISVDGDTSTNDTVLVFANGASGARPGPDDFKQALQIVCGRLARMIVADGEGTTKVVRVTVTGAADLAEARLAVRTVAESNLVKTALYGSDANWGRVVAALGRSGAGFDAEVVSISMAGVPLLQKGEPAGPEAVAEARTRLAGEEIDLECDLGAGGASAQLLSTDLTPEYVRLNAAYES